MATTFRIVNIFLICLLLELCFASFFPVCNTPPSSFCKRANCEVWYIDAETGSSSGTGTSAKPWRQFSDAFDRIRSRYINTNTYIDGTVPIPEKDFLPFNQNGVIRGGDVIVFRTGHYNKIEIIGSYPNITVTIMADLGATPVIDRILVRSAANWSFRCLNITMDVPTIDDRLVTFQGTYQPVYNLEFTQNTAYSYPSLEVYRSDSQAMLESTAEAIMLDRTYGPISVTYNYFYHVKRGIIVMGPDAIVAHNVINYVIGDGMRVMQNNTLVEFNTVMNSMNVDDNADHRDGLQMFTNGNCCNLQDIVIRNNKFIADEDPNRPFPDGFQGITAFSNGDLIVMNVTVENNLVSSINNYHGISLYWSLQCRIIGNTVIDVGTLNEFGLWISTAGGLGGNVIQNNIAQGLQDSTGSFINTNNFDGWTLKQLKLYFVDPEKFDFHLKNTSDSPFIGKGNSTTAPTIDITGSFRKGAYDLGCYAFSSVAMPPSNSAGNSTTEPVATQHSENVSLSEIQMPGIASIIISLLLLVGAPLL